MKQKKELELLEASIERLSHDGRGIARISGKTTFLDGALPGEVVRFHYTRIKKDFDEGKVIEILTSSPLRASPVCPHYGICGGCSLQHLHEKAQIHSKQELLLDSLKRIGHVQPEEVLEPLVSDAWHYRHKARLSVRYVEKKATTLIGFREKDKPRYIAEIDDCFILNAKVAKQIKPLKNLLSSFDSLHAIAQIEVAVGDEEVALIFRNLVPLTMQDEVKLKEFGKATGFALFLQPSGRDSIVPFYNEREDNLLRYSLPLQEIEFKFHPTDFTQINLSLNRRMVTRALELMALTSDDVVLDLFCGLGNFSLPLAKYCKRVIGVEGDVAMVDKARQNAADNGIHNVTFHSLNLNEEEALAKINTEGVTKILIDPPRSGALEIIKQLDKIKLTRCVYVSCNPATLARDSGVLVNDYGFRFVAGGVMDMFPHTAHVESIALFTKM